MCKQTMSVITGKSNSRCSYIYENWGAIASIAPLGSVCIFPCGLHTACINNEQTLSHLIVLVSLSFRLQAPQDTSEGRHNDKYGLFPTDDKAMKETKDK